MASRDTLRDTGLLVITPDVLLKAYACGIFPMAESAEDPELLALARSSFTAVRTLLDKPDVRALAKALNDDIRAAIEGLYQSGKTKMIGISNVTPEQLTQLCAKAAVKPMMVQNRCYAALGWDKEVREICRTQGIIYQGFSLLTANREVFADPGIRAIAQRLGAGLAQVVFRFAMQVGMLPLTGTTNPQHMKEDLQAEQFTLTDEDMQVIETIGM